MEHYVLRPCRPSLGLGNAARAEILEGDVWGALKIENRALRAATMIVTATVGPLWGSEIQPEPTSWSETSGEHCKSSITYWVYDSPGSCRPSLGLGNPARAEILEGDVWGALKIEHYVLPP